MNKFVSTPATFLAMSIATSLVILSTLSAPAVGANKEVGNGGAGVVHNGQYLTFYSAGLYVEPINQAQMPFQLPALSKLLNYIASVPYVGLQSKRLLLEAIQATNARQYMLATPGRLTPQIKARLLAEFKRVTGVDPTNMDLFALTDTNQKITYLLPGFEKLNLADQMAILFHEAYWILHPNATYNEVVKAEMAFQAALSRPNDPAIVYDFVKYVGDTKETLETRLQWELAAGNLDGFVNAKGQFKLGQLLGAEYIACRKSLSEADYVTWAQYNTSLRGALDKYDICGVFFRGHLSNLIAKYPKSMILRNIAGRFDGVNDRIAATNVVNLLPEAFGSSREIKIKNCEFFKDKEFWIDAGSNGALLGYNNVTPYWNVQDAANCVVNITADSANTTCESLNFTFVNRSTGAVGKCELDKNVKIHTEL